MHRYWRLTVFAVVLMAQLSESRGEDWARFRGPNGSGISSEAVSVPTTWSETENLKWKVSLPGPGSSCPIVVGDKVFITCWSGYGVSRENPGNQSDLKRHLICMNRKNGDVLWMQDVVAYLPEDEYGGMFAEHGYASHTPVSDGEYVYAFFGKTGAIAFDMNGKQIWQRSLGTESGDRNWGTASSPILYKELLIVPATAESEALVALNKKTGAEVWRQEAGGFRGTWGSPILVSINADRTDLVLAVPGEIWGFNPDTGKLRWYSAIPVAGSYCSSVVTDGQLVYGGESGPGGGGTVAVKAGGDGEVKAVWTTGDSGRIGTPLVQDGRLYFFSGSSISCLDATTGNSIYQARLQEGTAAGSTSSPEGSRPPGRGFGGGRGGGRGGPGGGQNYASPVIADGKIYFQTRAGSLFVMKTGDKFERLAVNRVTNEAEDFSATPAISNGELFIRSSKHLYCIGTN